MYLKEVKDNFPDVITIADSVDVHWLRESRANIGSEDRKNFEKNVYESCDLVIAVTHEDKEEIEKVCGKNVIVKVVSNIHQEPTSFLDVNKKDIIFLGGFNHHPNINAALRSYDIYKKFKKETKEDCSLYIVGDEPPEKIKNLHDGKEVFVTGLVEDISPYMFRSKVLIAPLDSGAGIKGKICEAIVHKVPVLTTKIGAEGFGIKNLEDCFIADSDREFVGSLKCIYGLKEESINCIASNALDKTKRMISKESAVSTIKHIIGENRQVVVSIVTYKNEEILEECLMSIIDKTPYKSIKVIVTDNAAESRVEKLVHRLRTNIDIEYVKNEVNEFFSAPHNRVIKRFINSDIILLNDDTIIKSNNWVSTLQETAYISGEIAGCGGKALMPNGKLEEAGTFVFNDGSVRNIGRDDDPNKEDYNKKKFVSYCSWSMFYLKRDAIEKVGLLDEGLTPLYYEDTDWQYRAHREGFKIIYEPNCIYLHKGRSTTRGRLNEYSEASKQKFLSKYKDQDLEAYNEVSRWMT
jgi:GT2 family glycosyltransferase